jgi:hypothetical protein
MKPSLFKPSEITLLKRGLHTMTECCEVKETIIQILEKDLAASKLRCEELIARNNALEERHFINNR